MLNIPFSLVVAQTDVLMNVQTKSLTIAGKKGKKGFKSSVIKKKTNVKSSKPEIPDTRSPVLENKAKVVLNLPRLTCRNLTKQLALFMLY